ncbi:MULTISPECIES: Rv1733c family protein [Streptomyces]|uniref:Rv1733c family protein n=1 Tax=Streptomyces TaxID=1883 RepID=UPI0032548FBA
MTGGKYAKKRLWRWRGNPLQRRDDIVEAWIVLAVWTVFAVGGTVAGLVTFHAADEVFARQRAERQSVRAVLLDDVLVSTTAVGVTSDRRTTSVRWTAPDGSARTGRTLVDTGRKAGSRVTVWQDGQGRLTAAPRSSTEAAIESGFLGAAAAAGLAGLVFGAGAVARSQLDRRRVDGWGREWDQVGPEWSHKTS